MKPAAAVAAGLVIAVMGVAGGYSLALRVASGQEQPTTTDATATQGEKKVRKVLYYRNPMGLPDTSPVPKKDPMGMDYIPVFEGESDDEPASGDQLRISTDKVQKLGVRTETAELRNLNKTVQAAGRIEPDEQRTYAITPKFEGYVERLHVNITGQPVAKGQALLEVYSPELVSAQREYAIAAQGVDSLKEAGNEAHAGMLELAESSLLRLRNWDISEEQIRALAKSGATKRTLTFRSPVAGIVTEKKALQGMRFMPGETLYQVADLSRVWVVADVFEQDIGLVRTGAQAKVRINAYPDKTFEGRVGYVYPTLNTETRTVPVRVELANPNLQLKPGMFAQVDIPVGGKEEVLTVPASSVIDSGARQIVLVARGEGRFEPREVKLGARSTNQVEILDGIKTGESVVVAANFLIDAESNLKAAVGGFGHASHGSAPKSGPESAPTSVPSKAAGHRAEGQVESLDVQAGSVMLAHGPIASLQWPAMTMEFKLANTALQRDLKPGAKVAVEFVERQPGEWVITAVTPAGDAAKASSSAPNPHAGH